MTFDEALDQLEPRTIWSSEMRDLLEQLRETYAPTIKMTTAEQVRLLDYMEMSSLRDFMEELLYQDDLYQRLSDEEIAQAWLHPETIKIVDE